MGVPSFYKWLVGKYPNIVVPAKEDDELLAGAGSTSSSSSPPPGDEQTQAAGGPNGVYHNLYLDMNGIIHPCFHPEDQVGLVRFSTKLFPGKNPAGLVM